MTDDGQLPPDPFAGHDPLSGRDDVDPDEAAAHIAICPGCWLGTTGVDRTLARALIYGGIRVAWEGASVALETVGHPDEANQLRGIIPVFGLDAELIAFHFARTALAQPASPEVAAAEAGER